MYTPIMAGPRCWSCGYELSGMPREGKCPECGSPFKLPEHTHDEREMLDGRAVSGRAWRWVPLIVIMLFVLLVLRICAPIWP